MAILNFQKPDKIVLNKATEFEGTFEFRPLEPGFGVTIGNSLRRILLSSLEGYAITSVKIAGVDHEFSTIKGVIEDMTEIVLNLKQIRLKKIVENDLNSEKIVISIKGKEELKAETIEKHNTSFKVMNPDLLICRMDPNVKMDLEITIAKGRGYVSAEDNKLKENFPLGTIAIDSIHTPIKNVKYSIENTRVEQKTDYEKLILEVSTDGTIHPEEAVKESARILIQHLMIISDDRITFDDHQEKEEQVVDDQVLHMRKLLKTPLEDLDLSVRAYNCLKTAKINSLSELVRYDMNDLLKFRNFGKKSLTEIEAMVHDKGLHFGMDLTKYKLEE